MQGELVSSLPPYPIAADLDRANPVAGPAETLRHGRRGGQRHIVLGRAAPAEHRCHELAHLVDVDVDVVVGPVCVDVLEVVVVEEVTRPVTIVTLLPLSALEPPPGFCERTTPAWAWLVTFLV